MQAAQRVAVNTGILYARMAITVFISLYTTRLILNALGEVDFGIFNVVGGAIAMLTFLNTAMTVASQRFMSYAQGEGNAEKQKQIFNISLILHLLIGLAVVVLLEVAGYFLFGGILNIAPDRIDTAKLVYQYMVVSTFFSIVAVPWDAVVNARENMLFVAVLGLLESFLKLGIAIYITTSLSDKLAVFGLLTALSTIILFVIRWIYCRRKYSEAVIRFRNYFDKGLFAEMTRFAGWSFLGTTGSMLANYGQSVVLNMFFGTVVNAAHGVSAQISGQLSAFSVTMMKALNPVIAKSEGAGNRDFMLRASLLGSKVSFFLLVFFYVPVLVEMDYIFRLWLKHVPDYAIIFCRLLLIRTLIEQLFLTLTGSINAVGKIKAYQSFSAVLNILPLILSWLLFYLGYPPQALYYIFMAYSVANGMLIMYFSKKYCGLQVGDFCGNVIFRTFFAFLVILLISFIPNLLMEAGFMRLVVVSFVSLSAFLAVTWWLGFNSGERIYLSVVMQELKHKVMKFKK